MELFSLVLLFTMTADIQYDDFCSVTHWNDLRDYYSEWDLSVVDKIHQDPVVLKFLSKFPDSEFRLEGVDESMPPRQHYAYSYYPMHTHAYLKIFSIPCIIHPYASEFYYADQEIDMNINVFNEYDLDSYTVLKNDLLIEAIQETSLYNTHEKWIGQNGKILYVFPNSSEELMNRDYLLRQVDFFDFKS